MPPRNLFLDYWISPIGLRSEDGAKISTISEGGAKAPEWI